MHQPLLEVFLDENASGVAYKNKPLKKAIITYLDGAANATVADLSKELNISTPKVINLINELIQDELIKDYGKVDSTGGRRASMYGLVAEAGFFIDVDIKKFSVNIGLLDFYGKAGFSGEFGHIPFFNNEILCHCGKKGCLETEASGNALIRLFKEKIQEGSSSQLISKYENVEQIKLQGVTNAAQKDDMLCIKLIANVGEKN